VGRECGGGGLAAGRWELVLPSSKLRRRPGIPCGSGDEARRRPRDPACHRAGGCRGLGKFAAAALPMIGATSG
jgi:hypothetical protein